MQTKYKINETIEDTNGFGTVVVKDIFISTVAPDRFYCYRVETVEGTSMLCGEEELKQME